MSHIPAVAFTKIRSVKSPKRSGNDAGTDFFIPDATEDFLKVLKEKNENNGLSYKADTDQDGNTVYDITVPANHQVMIPSGIRVWIYDKNTYLKATNKSGVASKLHFTVGANTIDADYKGEVHLNLMNVGDTPVTIRTGQKIVQFIHMEYIKTEWAEMTPEEYERRFPKTDRESGAFGSTGSF